MMEPSNRWEQEEGAQNEQASKKIKINEDDDERKMRQNIQREFPNADESFMARIMKVYKESTCDIRKQKKEAEKKIKEAENYSLSRLIRKPPTMRLKAFVRNNDSHTGKSKHEKAEVKMNPHVKLQEIKDSDQLQRPSRLLLKFHADDGTKGGSTSTSLPLETIYSTESDISSLVSPALEDAVILLGHVIERKFYVRHEFSLFSDRPDHLVLYDAETNDPILAIEDKMSWDNNNDNNGGDGDGDGEDKIPGPVRGQVFDYIMELRAFGHFAPFVVLTTFLQSWLFWQGDEESNEVVSVDNKLPYALRSLADPVSPTRVGKGKKTTPSPPELIVEKIESTAVSKFEILERNGMQMSAAYGSDKLVPLLYTALLCSLGRNPAARCRTTFKLSEGHNGLALKLDEKSYEWGHLKITVGVPVQFQPKNSGTKSRPAAYRPYSKKAFFVARKIARGATSKVFGAYDKDGHPCVIKMYVKRADDASGKPLTIDESRKQGEELCRLEVDRLTTFYDFLEGKVSYELLNKFPCVVMPEFEPPTKDEFEQFKDQDTNTREMLKSCLSKFKDERGKCWKYTNDDIRWRHFGYYVQEGKEKQMVMFDLAELEEVSKGDFETNVQSQVKNLLDLLLLPALERPKA